MSKKIEREAYSLREVSDATSISRRKLSLDIKNGVLIAKKIGTRTIVLKEDLDRYLQRDVKPN
jgi:hypothetical protein